MRLLIREYLSSLRERGELDAILPDLLSELGYTVLSRPSRGTRQYGVDVAALGPPDDERLYLFSIKRGDLTRADWDDGSQALRPSLNEIRDAYIPAHVPQEHRGRKVVICLCFGGDVHEDIRLVITNYQKDNQTERISYEEWGGDRLAGLIEAGLLQEGLLTSAMRSSFRKSVAMLDEPQTSFAHFSALVTSLRISVAGKPERDLVKAARQITICTWILFVWSRDAGNVEAAYLAAERAALTVWHILRDLVRVRRPSRAAGEVLNQAIELHQQVADELTEKLLPHAAATYALSAAVRSQSPLDINMRMHDVLGRLALRGLWLAWGERNSAPFPAPRQGRSWDPRIDRLAEGIAQLVSGNPALLMPVSEGQATDLALAFTFLAVQGGASKVLANWLQEVVQRTRYAFRNHKAYPCIHTDYADLAGHPRHRTDDYRKAATAASVLLPTLAVWAAGLGDLATLHLLAEFKKNDLAHCTFQLWLPGEDSEATIYINTGAHGAAFTDIPVEDDPAVTLDYVSRECGTGTPFHGLSAVEFGHWPLVAVACRHFRLPVPPHLWTGLLTGLSAA